MTALLIPDNTVLVRFARIRRMDLLAALVGANGVWCGTVAGECDRSARVPGLESITEAHVIFGEPLRLQTAKEMVDTLSIQVSLSSPGDAVHHHLGEAEAISIVSNRSLDAVFVTDDRSAARRAEENGIRTYTTWDLLKLAVRVGFATAAEAYGYVRTLGGHRERFPHVATLEAWCGWCGE